ncbi:MAG: Rieske 2Fe-2S domain-containing protein [Nitrospirota bacterium]
MAREYAVAKVSEVGPGQRKLVAVNGAKVVLINQGGTYYAINNECPHEGNPLCDGEIKDCTLVCPTHEWEFSLKTGEADDHPGFEAQVYPVRVDGAELKITM